MVYYITPLLNNETPLASVRDLKEALTECRNFQQFGKTHLRMFFNKFIIRVR